MNLTHGITAILFASYGKINNNECNRREMMSKLLLPFGLIALNPRSAHSYESDIRRITLSSNKLKLGLKLKEVTIGNPQKTVITVEQVDPFGLGSRSNIEAGQILLDYTNPRDVVNRIQNGPFPLELKFATLVEGDAFGDLQNPLISPKDAMLVARQPIYDEKQSSQSKVITVQNGECSLKSRRGDVIGIDYTASYYSNGSQGGKIVYDSSAQRGTGMPYQFVLGSGDMIPGVDLGLYDMCVGEIREIQIPYQLAYGERGNKLFKIPKFTNLSWTVKLVELDAIRFD